MLPYVKYLWSGRHIRQMSTLFKQNILSIEQKNNQQFIPTLLVIHNTIPYSELQNCDKQLQMEWNQLNKGCLFISLREAHSTVLCYESRLCCS